MRVAVLGAGVIGVSTAHSLRRAGCEVVVVDRHDGPARETSFANGGQISVSHAEPWANPRAPRKLARWLLSADAPLRIALRADPALWRWLLGFLRECSTARTRHNVGQLVALGLYSRRCLQALRSELQLEYDQRTQGILHLYTDARELEAAQTPARWMRELGCERRVLDTAAAVAIEPALAAARDRLVGATYTPDDESGDAYRFSTALAADATRRGVEWRWQQQILRLDSAGDRISGVVLRDAHGNDTRLQADAYVLALGSYSAALLRPLGIRLNLQPAKGYSLTLPVRDPARAYSTALIDDEYKLVYSRLGDRLRIAGMAELRGTDLHLDPRRCALLLRRTEQLFPGAGDPAGAIYWCGLRPSTPSNLPYLGRSRLANLFLNTGHGTLGWTHACGSAQLLTDVVLGRTPALTLPDRR